VWFLPWPDEHVVHEQGVVRAASDDADLHPQLHSGQKQAADLVSMLCMVAGAIGAKKSNTETRKSECMQSGQKQAEVRHEPEGPR
jgi:hypothetical protein